jgi:predicted transcriptional regulator
MTLTVNLSAELEGRLKQAAEAEGVPEDEFVIRTLEQYLMGDRRQAALTMLRQWQEEDASADPAEIADRRRSWEAFKDGLNENHSSGRKVYP